MIDVQDFIEEYYGVRPAVMFSLKEFDNFKSERKIEEWDYPLEEYEHIAENKIKCVPVRFAGPYIYSGYEYRFCEIPE